MKKKKSLCLSAAGIVISASTTVGVLLTRENKNFNVVTKSKNIETKKTSLTTKAEIN